MKRDKHGHSSGVAEDTELPRKYTTCHNNVGLHVLSMDESSLQLQLDLCRAVQHELASRRPLIHRLHGSSWVLQIPRPTNAVRHGSRFYYNILVDPCFGREPIASKGWFSQPSPQLGHLQTTAALEELLKDLEILASDLRPESSRKSNFSVEDELGRLRTLVDAVAVTSVDKSDEDSLRQIHPDVPCYASQEAGQQICALQHFRTLGKIDDFGEVGCKDWRSTTAVAGLPEWLGLSTLPEQDDGSERSPPLLVAFNNYHHNSSARLAKLQSSTGSRQKRHAVPNEDEDVAEAVLFTTRRLSSDHATLISRADPAIHLLAIVCGGSLPAGSSRQLETSQNTPGTLHMTAATYHVAEHNMVVEKGKGFLAWLIAKAHLSTPGKQALQSSTVDHALDGAESDTWGSYNVRLSNGETKVLI